MDYTKQREPKARGEGGGEGGGGGKRLQSLSRIGRARHIIPVTVICRVVLSSFSAFSPFLVFPRFFVFAPQLRAMFALGE